MSCYCIQRGTNSSKRGGWLLDHLIPISSNALQRCSFKSCEQTGSVGTVCSQLSDYQLWTALNEKALRWSTNPIRPPLMNLFRVICKAASQNNFSSDYCIIVSSWRFLWEPVSNFLKYILHNCYSNYYWFDMRYCLMFVLLGTGTFTLLLLTYRIKCFWMHMTWTFMKFTLVWRSYVSRHVTVLARRC